jgi:hypothetical protein
MGADHPGITGATGGLTSHHLHPTPPMGEGAMGEARGRGMGGGTRGMAEAMGEGEGGGAEAGGMGGGGR